MRIRPDQARGTYRRSPEDASIQTCIATPVVGSTNRSSVGRNRPSGGCVSPPPGPMLAVVEVPDADTAVAVAARDGRDGPISVWARDAGVVWSA